MRKPLGNHGVPSRVWRSLARISALLVAPFVLSGLLSGLAASVMAACGSAPPPASAPPPPPRASIPPPPVVEAPATPCEGTDLDLWAAKKTCACSTKDAPNDHACAEPTDNASPDLVVRAVAIGGHVKAGDVLTVELVLENHGTRALRIDLPPAFHPELVVFSPAGARIEPPNGTTACPLADTGRFVSSKVRVAIAPGGRAHATFPWHARAVAWDETRHTDWGRCALTMGAPLPKGTYEMKIISDMLGIGSDEPSRNPRVTFDVE